MHTRDRDGARAFFTRVVGWTIAPCDPSKSSDGPVYEEWVAQDGAHIGGMMSMPPGVPAHVPSHFATYVNVDDVDATAARAVVLGGALHMAPMNIPDVGRFAVIADPTGAVLNLFKGCGAHGTKSPQSSPGHFCWNELHSTNPTAAIKFYCELLGYTATTMPMPTGEYTMLARPGTSDEFVAGVMKSPACASDASSNGAEGHSCWLAYVSVSDVDATARAALAAGGTVLAQPSDVPGFGRSAVIADATGAALGLFAPAR